MNTADLPLPAEPQATGFVLADHAPPRAPLAMPTQVLERQSPGLVQQFFAWASGLTARPQG